MHRILVTGGTGFVGGYAVLRLLDDGYEVRTTVRNLSRADELRHLLAGHGAAIGRLEIVSADLTKDDGWPAAAAGCQAVLHVASPFPSVAPDDPEQLVRPARDGAIRVLAAARDAGVDRVVLTSSFAAVGYSPTTNGGIYTEQDWTDPKGQPAYIASKAIAERAAWDFVAANGGPDLAVINPTGIFGPALGPDYSGSLGLIKQLLDGALPGTPNLAFGVVDVRDVVDAHLRAMTNPRAAGERFIVVGGSPVTMHEIAMMLRSGLGPEARKVPTRQLPSWLVRGLARFRPQLRPMVPELGKRKQISNAKARAVLGWTPRSVQETIIETGRSLLQLS
ncbi:dihydroflavonol-4-reductase [Microlunatus endophyticus]|uniref:Dihydroflavonol-4-reductase n=1 Tax=Microlunatus endophyticus TaxID=1716077 RepID=A0A917S3Z0_9ACTN|nr:NAD-dependent epimerase/dehydratase family protein [Microlunatus endophyticus]GGL56218.1 dihydroflavonol-4-reductase [Microlunatus endophyticus]